MSLLSNSMSDKSGFDLDKFADQQELDEFMCGVCHGIYRDPLVTECCGQTYCSFCIKQWLSNAQTCPNDRQPLTLSGLKEPPKAFKNLLSNLRVKCDFLTLGCAVQVKLSEMESHRQNCEHRPNIKCKTCGFRREEDTKHDCLQSLLAANKTLEEEKTQMKDKYENKLNKQIDDFKEQMTRDMTQSIEAQIKGQIEEQINKLKNKLFGSESHDEDMDEINESRSEATFRYKIENFSKLKDKIISPPTIVRNIPWNIMAMPRNKTNTGQKNKSLGFYLLCDCGSQSTTWSCKARAELKLVAQKEEINDMVMEIDHQFNREESDWGFSSYMEWQKILDPKNGYIKDDAIILEISLCADIPQEVEQND